ncbi:hypothetical protein O9H85_17515 [Paenibacillus filicis]|uniref:Uncharacterized protein n=1 Tax=Paenibacillus gyeongsangnamensis TaxID=3388067 RepID=A0ABT4QBD0_9BACL|nr:hypothetical protein [Paenibacillus filicis]MCZ8514193.1 hypothetical protein [Paenibacillus filicis]
MIGGWEYASKINHPVAPDRNGCSAPLAAKPALAAAQLAPAGERNPSQEQNRTTDSVDTLILNTRALADVKRQRQASQGDAYKAAIGKLRTEADAELKSRHGQIGGPPKRRQA